MIHPLIFCPSIEGGGVEKNLFLISNFLSQKVDKVYLLTANKDMKGKFNKKIIFISPKSRYWSNKNRILKSLICFFLFLKLKKKFLVISFQSNILAIIISKIFNYKIIIRSNTSPEKYLKNNIKKIIFKFFFKMANEIIVNSYSFKNSLNKILGLKSVVIYNPTKKIKLNKINKIKNTINIINVGRLTDQKNQLLLLSAVQELSKKIKWKLSIIGKGNNYRKISDFINKNNLKKKVRLYGYKKNSIKEIYKSDLFVLTSNYEGLPNVLIEAQQVGTPIISTNCKTGPKEILLNGKLGELIPLGNKSILVKKIEDFYFNRKKYIKKSNLAKKYLYRFDYNKNCNLYYNLFKKYLYEK
jgi:glycosyltransferase involved in cell wall biosynthesis